jgi:hypothetical protein
MIDDKVESKRTSKLPEMWQWMVAAVILCAVVAWKSPNQFPVLAYKGLLLCGGLVISHWVDNTFFKDKSDDVNEIARAIVFVGVMLALTLGL